VVLALQLQLREQQSTAVEENGLSSMSNGLSEVVELRGGVVTDEKDVEAGSARVNDSDGAPSGSGSCDGSRDVSPEGGDLVLGYFRPETFSKMGIAVAVGQRLRIYDSVLLPSPSDSGLRSSAAAGRMPILLNTSLCETLQN
jgi:hypothetical protein